MNPYNNWFYNPAVFNQRAYEEYVAEMQRRQAYEQNQTLGVLKVSKVFDDHIDIIYNSPVMRTDSPDESQGFSFYRGIVHRTFKDPHKADITRITLVVIMRV